MKGTVELIEGVNFRVTSGSGHTTCTDGPPQHGGTNAGMRPMEMVLLGMGGCTAYDVVEILRKSRRTVSRMEIQIEAARADDIPQVFTDIHLVYKVGGQGIQEKQVQRAIELSINKYCSATRMLSSTAKVTYQYEIV